MIKVGNFFFKHRNWIFILFYAALFIPSWPLFSKGFGVGYYVWPISIGLLITCIGQLIRGLTIGLTPIVKDGKKRTPFADNLIITGLFNHCRNPLYIGNILMLLGIGILANSLLYVAIIIPVFLFIYQSIVLAEENFLREKFGSDYEAYCKRINRWWPRLKGFDKTISSMTLNWKRWVISEHTILLIWLVGITLILFLKYPELTGNDIQFRNLFLIIVLGIIILAYVIVRYLYKSGRLKE